MLNSTSTTADSTQFLYRGDIDGLRAIAVIAVVVFHLARKVLPGGYLGVDVFFVISGYLITSIIWREALKGNFSISRFYDRRIKRIVPALATVLIACTTVATILFLPADLVGYGKSALATIAFVSNVYFWRDTDYFSRSAEEKPLLHMWSLSVEEQFYILFPPLLVLIVKFKPSAAFGIIAILSLISLATNCATLYVGGASPAFFLLPTRAWELGAGAILALWPKETISLKKEVTDPAAMAGLFFLIVAIFFPTKIVALPDALLAVLGTSLIILAGTFQFSITHRFLSSRPLVSIGLISYSLYLWHWPVIVFLQYYLTRDLQPIEMVGSFVCMLLLATASTKYVELPFREDRFTMPALRLASGVIALVIGSSAFALIMTRGLPGRLSNEAAMINAAVETHYRCPVSGYVVFGASRGCIMNLPSRKPSDADVVLLGNSHAQMYAPAVENALVSKGLTGLLVPLNGCLPTVVVNISVECASAAQRNLVEVAKLARAKLVIVAMTWKYGSAELVGNAGEALDNFDNAALIRGVDDLVEKLRAQGKRVVLVGPIARPGWDVASILSREIAFNRHIDHPLFQSAEEFQGMFGTAIRHFSKYQGIKFLRPDEILCTVGRCEYLLDGKSIYSDDNHIASAELFRFKELFEAALP